MEYLLSIASTLGIEILYVDLHAQNQYFDGYAWPARRRIVLDRSIRGTRQEKCVLAEEIGHILYPPAADHIAYHSRRFRSLPAAKKGQLSAAVGRDERAALRWATSALIPDDDFWWFGASASREWHEWLDEFEVTDWFMTAKFRAVRNQMQQDAMGPPPFDDHIISGRARLRMGEGHISELDVCNCGRYGQVIGEKDDGKYNKVLLRGIDAEGKPFFMVTAVKSSRPVLLTVSHSIDEIRWDLRR